jgi:hypothetical protein
LPKKEEGYNLMYAPLNTYMFLKFFHAIYERVSYAKILINEKIDADLAEMSKQEMKELNIEDKK